MKTLKSLAVILAACVGMVLGVPATAGAAHARHEQRPCWKAVINDWLPDARVDGTYRVRCYQQALAHLPPDLQQYSSAEQDFKRALLLAAVHNGGKPPSPNALIKGTRQDPRPSGATPTVHASQPGFFRRTLDWLGPANATSIPTPLLVLGGIALLLLLAGAGSFAARWYQGRRFRPAPGSGEH